MFTYFVTNLLELEVISLDYPGHVTTAVKTNSNTSGDKIRYRGKEYLICDPIYINDPAGRAMDSYKGNEQEKSI